MSPRFRPAGSAIVMVVATAALSGCISIFPKERPAQLYRFDFETARIAPGPSPAASPFTVRGAPVGFDRAAAGDRILTATGNQVAYVAGARWVTPAAGLFEAATGRAFERIGGAARLLAPGEPSPADYLLKMDVRTFEARYDHGAGSPPTVNIEVYAALVRPSDARDSRSRLFVAHTQASSNSVHAITAAFNASVGAVLTDMVTWVNAKGAD